MPAGKTMASVVAATVAPRACPNSRVVSSMPEANPRFSSGSESMTVALFIGLNIDVPMDIGIISKGIPHMGTDPENMPSIKNPPAMATMAPGLKNRGWYRS